MNGQEDKKAQGQVREILARVPNWVGDCIFAIPAVQRLKREFPSARLTVLVARWLVPIWELVEGVDEIIPFELRGGIRDLPGKRRLVSQLRDRNFDLAVIFPRSFESALWIHRAGVPRRWGYKAGARSFLLTRPVRSDQDYRQAPRIDYYYRLLDGGRSKEPPVPARLAIPPAVRRQALDLLSAEGIDPDKRPLVGFHPRASYGPAKCWPAAKFSRLAGKLTRRRKAIVLLFGSGRERQLLEEIVAGAGKDTVNLAGRTDLKTLAALLSLCRVVVANDSGPLHLAAALGVPVVGLYGSTDPVATGPRGARTRVIYKGISCSPCLYRVCPRDFACMERITPEEVLTAVEELWPAEHG